MIDITPIVQAIVALLAAIVTCVLIPLIRARTTLSQRQEVSELVQTAVTAAEQIYSGSGRGEEKKAYVLAWLQEQGITVNESEINAMIESAVHYLNSALTNEMEQEDAT